MSHLRKPVRILSAIAITGALLAGGIAATSAMASPAKTVASGTQELWAAAQSAPVQSPVAEFPHTSGIGTLDSSQVGAGLQPGFGNAGEIHRLASYSPAGSALTIVPTSQAANGLGGAKFPYITSGTSSAHLFETISVIPDTPTGTRSINLLSDPGFTDMATSLGLSGGVYVMGADRETGVWEYDSTTFSTQVSGSLDGTVTISSTRLNPAGYDAQTSLPSINLSAMTQSGNQVMIGLSLQLVVNGRWDTSLSASNKIFDATVGQQVTISADQMRTGAFWAGGSIGALTPALSNIPTGSTPTPDGGLLYTPTAVGDVPFSYRLVNGPNSTQLMPALIRVTDTVTPDGPSTADPTPPVVTPMPTLEPPVVIPEPAQLPVVSG